MNKAAIKHIPDSVYAHSVDDNTIEIRLETARNDDIEKVELIYNDKFLYKKKVKTTPMYMSLNEGEHTWYFVRIKTEDKRLGYAFKITSKNETLYYLETGFYKEYNPKYDVFNFFEFSFLNSSDIVSINKKFQNRVCYQIFVDRFCKDDGSINPRINIKWGDKITSKSIAGGTLKGITEKLDYLAELGINMLYLTPVTESQTNHKYNTQDYMHVAKDFGTDEDLKTLIDEAHKRDILVVLDAVFNHTCVTHPFFQDVMANGRDSKYYDWYYINGDKPDFDKCNYSTFSYAKYMPRLNTNNPACREYILNVSKHYVRDFKIDGYRLDVSDEISHSFWMDFRRELKAIDPSFFIIGEKWHSANSFLDNGKEFDSIMNYSLYNEMLQYFEGSYDAIKFIDGLNHILVRYKDNTNYQMLNFLSTHDIQRFLEFIKGNKDIYLAAYAFLLMYIGIPCIYYGDEVPLRGKNDPDCRRCFPWNDKSLWDEKVFKTIKELISLHRELKINERLISLNHHDGVFYLKRYNDANYVVLAINNTKEKHHIDALGEVISSNKLKDDVLLANGYAIYLIDRAKNR